MKARGILLIFMVAFTSLLAQDPGDCNYVFTSLEEAMENPEQVYHLNLEKDRLREVPQAIFKFKNLKTLVLKKNKISQIPIEIGKLKELEKLDLSKNKITILPPQMALLSNLRYLYLSKNNVEEVPEAFGKLLQLKELDLWLNNVKEIDAAIYELPELKRLDLRGMLLSDELQKELMEGLPDTEVLISNKCDCGF